LRVERPTSGRILLAGFQKYTLAQHMTVGEIVAFPLSVRRIPRAGIFVQLSTMP